MYVCMYVCMCVTNSVRFQDSHRMIRFKFRPSHPIFSVDPSRYEFESSNLAFVAKCLLTKSSSSNIINITYRDMSREASPSRLVDDTKACSWEIIYVTDLIYLIAKPSCHLLEPYY